MAPVPLSPNVLHVLLQYPIPPHLLSKPLLQRHHFLHLSPEDPDEYLCWPSSPQKKAEVIGLLETRSRPVDDDLPTVYPVQYSFDGEDFFAHVDLSCGSGNGPRLILQWDQSGEWKYHNADLMPFPPGTRPNLEDVLIPPPAPNPVTVRTISTPSWTRNFEANDLQDDSDDDDYWNAYGSTDIGDSLYGDGAPASAKDAASTEDAYWARYASVQGTADSTIPSPIPQGRRKALPQVQSDSNDIMDSPVPLPVPVRVPSEDTYAEPLPIPPSIIPRPRSNSRWDPASPTTLARLLSSISPRESPAESPAPDGSFDMEEELSSPTVGGSDDSDLSSSPALGLQGTDTLAVPSSTTASEPLSQAVALPSLGEVTPGLASIAADALPEAEGDAEVADLQAALEGVWKMWRRNRMRRTTTGLSSLGDTIFEKTFTKNTHLEARVEELERELSVWKDAFKTADGDRKVLHKTVLRLERSIGALKEDNPLILCLIDGDGNIFSSDLIKQGHFGGRQAAMLLTKGLTDYLSSVDPTDASAPGRGQLWLTIYCNKNGLLDTLLSNHICTSEEFEAFVLGFNQASPLFSVVDVGNGKEAADSKIKEFLRVFTRFPQTTKVFFGGAHDNGYTSTLNLLQNEGLLDKVVLLKGYKDLAHEINNLNLPQLEVEGVFIQKKLQTNGKQKVTAAAFGAAATPVTKSPKPPKQSQLQTQENDKARFPKPGTPSNIAKPATPVRKSRPLDPEQAKALLESFGIQQKQKQVATKRKPDRTKKRVAPQDAVPDTADDDHERPNKVQKVEDDSGNVSSLRRSSRNKGKALDYNDNGASAAAAARSLPRVVSARARAGMQGEPRNTSIRKHDPKTYGAIPGIPVGSWWETRAACSQDAVHAPWVAGISSGPEGAYSVALSGGYEDDVDLGDAFTFTGSGGRDLHGTKSNPKNLRTAPQSADQSFETPLNAALVVRVFKVF
ncbi:hypothetical protein C8Q80DRAFT_1215776 [Daedaleopsis nitida]|nr:hypothetical protein C8Q80DRAFT_1215776 [Daedaleopsis nitida]